jgi:hypothetical protein
MAFVKSFVKNKDDEHCLQSCYIMVVESGTGEKLDFDQADSETGFVKGRGTWQFQMMLSLADRGFRVVDHENFDPEAFVLDPTASIALQVGNESALESVLAVTDVAAEASRVQACLNRIGVDFTSSVPTLDDLKSVLDSGAYVMTTLNAKKFYFDDDGYDGHLVIIESISDLGVSMQDPFLEGGANIVDIDRFFEAWTSPSDSMANFVAAWPRGSISV